MSYRRSIQQRRPKDRPALRIAPAIVGSIGRAAIVFVARGATTTKNPPRKAGLSALSDNRQESAIARNVILIFRPLFSGQHNHFALFGARRCASFRGGRVRPQQITAEKTDYAAFQQSCQAFPSYQARDPREATSLYYTLIGLSSSLSARRIDPRHPQNGP